MACWAPVLQHYPVRGSTLPCQCSTASPLSTSPAPASALINIPRRRFVTNPVPAPTPSPSPAPRSPQFNQQQKPLEAHALRYHSLHSNQYIRYFHVRARGRRLGGA